jgi:isoleucyl-tRNA synthetase
LGPETQSAAAAAKRGDWALLDGGCARIGDIVLQPGEFDMRVTPLDGATTRALADNSLVVVLDTEVPEALAVEGRARDIVREVQRLRRDLGLDVTDRIALEVSGGPEVRDALETHEDWVAEQVLAVQISWVEETSDDGRHRSELADGTPLAIRIAKADRS